MMDLNTLLSKAQKKLEGVHPFIAEKALQLVTKAYDQKIYIIITQGYRTYKEQNELYAQGRTKPGKIVTKAKGGFSMHNHRLAFDYAVASADGKTIYWDEKIDTNKDAKRDYYQIGALGKSLGLRWGGDFRSFKDLPHFEYTFGLDIDDLLAGKKPPQTAPKQAVKGVTSPSVLKEGDKNSQVEQVQQKLIKLGYLKGNADGDFGPLTLQAVKQFQAKHDLSVDGIVGPITLSKINEEVIKMSNDQKTQEDEVAKAVAWAKEKGISNGERLNEPASREQVIMMLYRALGK